MSILFTSFRIKNLELKNRLIRSATTSYWSDSEGVLRKPILEHYSKLAKGGIGLIIKGHSYVMESGKAHIGQSGLTNEKQLVEMKKLVEIVHKQNIPFIAQLSHAGYNSINNKITASNYQKSNWIAKEASIEEIQLIIENFAHAAELAIQAGFDGVQIHAAHGYLISQFLSDNVNKRTDEYGGSLLKRAKLLFDIFHAIKKQVGNSPIISVKMNSDDFAPTGGLRINDSVLIANWLDERGIDFLELSGGGPEQNQEIRRTRGKPHKDSLYYEANFSGHAEKIRKVIPSVPLALVDGFKTKKAMESILKENIVDLISLSKPLINDPNLPKKLFAGEEKSNCLNCRECLSPERFGKQMLVCAQIKK